MDFGTTAILLPFHVTNLNVRLKTKVKLIHTKEPGNTRLQHINKSIGNLSFILKVFIK